MAANEEPVKDNSGGYFFGKDGSGNPLKDDYGKPIIDHDLDEIAEEFAKFAGEQKLDFWSE